MLTDNKRDIGRFPGARRVAGELAAARLLLGWLPAWLLLVVTLAGLVASYQIIRPYSVAVGTPQDEAYVSNFHARLVDSNGEPYRWSDVYGYVSFPGIGGGRPFTVTLQIDPGRTAPVSILINGETVYSQQLAAGWHDVTIGVGAGHPAIVSSRDVVVEIRAPEYRSPDYPAETKGVKVSLVTLEQEPGGFVIPGLATLAYLTSAVLLVYLLMGRALIGIAANNRARAWALAVAALSAVALVIILAWNHMAVSSATLQLRFHLAITLLTMLVLLVVTDGVLARRWPQSLVPARLLAVGLALAFGLRYGGMALPQAVIIDMPYHMKWLTTLLRGDWQSLYFPGGLSEVPREWGLDVLIPKSPLFYVAFAPLGALPLDLATSVKWLICLLDSSVVLGVAWICRRSGASPWAAALAGLVYAVMPLAFRAFSYGILPTIFAQWLATAFFVYFLAVSGSRWPVGHWIGLLVLLALTLLAFPTVALFVSMILVVVTIIWAIIDRNWRARAWQPPVLLAGAWALALLSYYGLYVGLVLTSISALLSPRPGGGTTVRWPGGFPDLITWTASYVVTLLPALLGLAGLVLLFLRRKHREDAQRAVWLLAAWAAVAPLFFLVNYRVDLIGKHLFFTMAPVAILAGITLWALARRNRWGTLLALLAVVTITWQAVTFWIGRLIEAST